MGVWTVLTLDRILDILAGMVYRIVCGVVLRVGRGNF